VSTVSAIHHNAVKTTRAARLMADMPSVATKYRRDMNMMELAGLMLQISNENKRLMDNWPSWCPECESMNDINGKCTNSTCNQNQRML
jgi:hypothetical protein